MSGTTLKHKLSVIEFSGLIISFIALLLFPSCSYGDFQTISIKKESNFYNSYLFKRNSDSQNKNLLVFLEGSSMNSVLGLKGKILPWKSFSAAYVLQKKLRNDFDILVPERMNMECGLDYLSDTLRLREYTLANRVNEAVKSIDNILSISEYGNVVIFGYSEGGLILPNIYKHLKSQSKISKLICVSYGGFSYYDLIKTTFKTRGIGQNYIDSTINEIQKDKYSITKFAFGHPYNKWNDFLYYAPVEDYKSIEIPILIIHGDTDLNAAVESSRYLKNKLDEFGKKKCAYFEIKNANHNFENNLEEFINILNTELDK